MPELSGVVPATADGPHYDEDVNLLNQENPEEVVEEEEPEEVAEVEEPEEEEPEEPEEEEEPPKVPFSRPSIKDIKAKYPDFFKDFPDIKEAIFREAKYTQYFPTVEDAQEAFSDNEAFNVLSSAALAGDPTAIIDSLHQTDPKALRTFSASFLSALYKKDPESHSLMVTPMYENLLREAYKRGDENMKNSALNIASFIFGDDGEDSVLGKKTLSQTGKILEDQSKASKDKEVSDTNAFRGAAGFVSEQVTKYMKILVAKDFDPDKVFTSTVRSMLVDDIVQRIDKQLVSDKGHITVMGARWKRAKSNGYTDDDKSKLVSTYLARAKALIPSVRNQVRTAAVGKTARAADDKRVKTLPPRKEVNGGPPRGKQGTTKDYSKMSDMEILNS
jgi:hypothetical protein